MATYVTVLKYRKLPFYIIGQLIIYHRWFLSLFPSHIQLCFHRCSIVNWVITKLIVLHHLKAARKRVPLFLGLPMKIISWQRQTAPHFVGLIIYPSKVDHKSSSSELGIQKRKSKRRCEMLTFSNRLNNT